MPLLGRRIGRPGLIGLAARTAVVAGTASAVSGARDRRNQQQHEQQQYEAAQQQAQIDAAAQTAVQQQAPAPAPAATDVATQLQQLASLKQSGVLSDEEFAAAKAKLLA